MPRKKQKAVRLPMLLRFWFLLTAVAPMILAWRARFSHRQQNAEQERFAERLGHASLARPAGPLIWIHAASVGEVTSVVKLARNLVKHSNASILMTTTTATGASTVTRLLPEAVHQFLPIDTPGAVFRFLNHWHPDAAFFVEGDLWPRMILSLETRNCPMALVNVRASRSRDRFPSVYSKLLSHMHLITAQDPSLLDGLRALGLDHARLHAPGNLKADIDAPPVNKIIRTRITSAAADRGLWACVSTHPGEETAILDTQARISGDPLLVLVPRHPERGGDLAAELSRRGLNFSRHSKGDLPDTRTQVHLVDVLGETGTVYAAVGVAFIGGSLVAGPGGHTPYEPLALGCAILSGPHVRNFDAAYKYLQAEGAAYMVPDSRALATEVGALLQDKNRLDAMQNAAQETQSTQGGATERTLDLIAASLPQDKINFEPERGRASIARTFDS
ncbi:MAG: 3-deoxy-D-manno-octulosonic acid transferase [Marinosulfonomonas sp.]|nr:3-deoxy-D-manno-octulosonic acid transferase [Marinosulfonomonas sp.]